jgi:DNA-binding IclR family transcriptional regulator
MDRDRDRYVIESVRKACEILKFIAKSREPVASSQLALEIENLTKDTAYRMCVTLDVQGLLNQVGDRYELGIGLGLFWSRKKATLESRRSEIEKAIELLGEE